MKALALSLLALSAACAAQAATWTLDSCINYAIEHNLSVRQNQLSMMSAEQSVTDAKSRYMPNVSANAGQNWNLGRGLTASNTYADRNTSSFNWGASLNMPVFSGLSTERQIAYAKANLYKITEQYEAAKEDVALNVVTAYLQVLYNHELHQLALQQVDLSEYELSRRQALADAGKIPEIDILEAKAQLASDQQSATQTLNDWMMSRFDLLQLLRLDVEPDDFDVAPLSGDHDMLISPDEAYRLALQNNHSIAAARRGIDASNRNLALAKTGYIPTLSFNGGVGSTYYKVSGMHNDSFSDQMKHNYSTYFGFSLNVPIFDGFSTRNSVKRAKIEQLNAQLQLDDAEQKLSRNIRQAYYQAIGAQKKLESSRIAEDAAVQAFEAMREKYDIGRATPSEYEQSKTKALRATAERIQANYELILRTRLLQQYALGYRK